MRIWIPVVVLGLVAAIAVFAREKTPRKEPPQPAEKPEISIDINAASTEDFQKLPGIGPKLAKRIVNFRQKHGPFRRVEDLLAIRGVGIKKWKAIRPFLRVGGSKNEKPAPNPAP